VDWPHTLEIPVRWADIDGAGHVNNANYFTYFESARIEAYYLAKGLDPKTARIEDLDIILARTSCDYRSQASMGEVLVVGVRPGRVGSTSFELKYEIREKTTGRLVAEGDSVQVCFDYAKQAKTPVPDWLRRALAQA
jgi:acyl-CoA thioester hydrolase